jgi:hypothetical protein
MDSGRAAIVLECRVGCRISLAQGRRVSIILQGPASESLNLIFLNYGDEGYEGYEGNEGDEVDSSQAEAGVTI